VIPSWWQAVILAAAAWRIFALLSSDDILDRPRRYVTRIDEKWEKEGDWTGDGYRSKLAEFIDCPYCLGFWVALAWWGAWLIWPHATLVAGTPFMLSAGLVALQRYLVTTD
jgi:hypothetical protein